MSDRIRTAIRTYNLFGEQADLPDIVHVETIEARSRLHDWEFAAHRHAGLYQVLLLEAGQGRVSLDGQSGGLSPPSLVNVPNGIVHGYDFTPGTRGLVVTLASEVVDELLRPDEGLRPVLDRPFVVAAPEGVRRLMHALHDDFATRDFGRAHVLRSSAGLLLGRIAQIAEAHGPVGAQPAPGLVQRFETLLDAHFADHLRVADYADALAVTPAHLSRLCRQATGRPASRLIEERIVREARRNLIYTNMSVSTVAYALGFDDPAYFSRVFSRATGLSPRRFRERQAEGRS